MLSQIDVMLGNSENLFCMVDYYNDAGLLDAKVMKKAAMSLSFSGFHTAEDVFEMGGETRASSVIMGTVYGGGPGLSVVCDVEDCIDLDALTAEDKDIRSEGDLFEP